MMQHQHVWSQRCHGIQLLKGGCPPPLCKRGLHVAPCGLRVLLGKKRQQRVQTGKV